MKRTLVALCIAALALPGCATRGRVYGPDTILIHGMVLDGKGKDKARLMADGEECEAIAQSTAPGDRAVAGAVGGAVVGALVGALIFRGSGLSGNRGATFGAGLGGISGAGQGAAAGAYDYKTVLRNCMIGRGHIPLN